MHRGAPFVERAETESIKALAINAHAATARSCPKNLARVEIINDLKDAKRTRLQNGQSIKEIGKKSQNN